MKRLASINDLKYELAVAQDIALQAGSLMLSGFHKFANVHKKNDYSFVTDVDLEINTLAYTILKRNFPEHLYIGEESTDRIMGDRTWVCDPIDGTSAYVSGIPTFTFSLALYDQTNTPLLGVCYDPICGRMLHTVAGEGTKCNDELVEWNNHPLEKGDVILTLPFASSIFGYDRLCKQIRLAGYRHIQVDSYTYAASLVILGKVKAAILTAGKPWDRAAIKLLLSNSNNIYVDEKQNAVELYSKHVLSIITSPININETFELLATSVQYEQT